MKSPSAAPAPRGLGRYVPAIGWMSRYSRDQFMDDGLAAFLVTAMMIPQSLAYALIAGLPAEAGLYASILPVIVYAFLGTSSLMAVGPVAVVSLLTAAAVGPVVASGAVDYASAALALAFMTGVMLLVFGLLRLGFLANFLSNSIISGFISAACVLIAFSQLSPLLGINVEGGSLFTIAARLGPRITEAHLPTLTIGLATIVFLVWSRSALAGILTRAGAAPRLARALARAAPLIAIIAAIIVAATFDLQSSGVVVVGETPRGLPPFSAPPLSLDLWRSLAGSAALIAIIGYVESVSIAHMLATRRHERIDLNQELVALGAANMAAGVSGGFPVAGGFARSIVNADAGARTPAAGAMTAIGILIVALFLTPLIFHLPKATLAAIIIVAVLGLIDLAALRRAFTYSRGEFTAMIVTIFGVLTLGVEAGVLSGVVMSIGLLLYRASRPHAAIVGQVPNTEHFRNVGRHRVVTSPFVAALRIDGDLFFANARFLEDRIMRLVDEQPGLRHVVLMCSAVNSIDLSALEALEEVNRRLRERDVAFHLSEVKGPVMDRLKRTRFIEALSGNIYLSQFQAMRDLDPLSFRLPHGATPDGAGDRSH